MFVWTMVDNERKLGVFVDFGRQSLNCYNEWKLGVCVDCGG